MTKRKWMLIPIILFLLIGMTIAYVLALPSTSTLLAKAEAETTYYTYTVTAPTLPFPMNGTTVSNYERTLVGSSDEGTQYKLFNIELYEKHNNELLYLGTTSIKITVMYDTGLLYYPIQDNRPVHWRDDGSWSTYSDNLGNTYARMTTTTTGYEEYVVDRIWSFDFQTLHELTKLVVRVFDPFTGYGIYTDQINSNHHELTYNKTNTAQSIDTTKALYSNQKDKDLSYTDGYNTGYTQGEIAGNSAGYEAGKNAGFEEGYEKGYEQGVESIENKDAYKTGYDVGYDEGHKKGYEEGSYDVNLELTNVAGNTLGSITDTIMTFLQFEIAGISLWSILAILGGIIVIGLIVKMVS